MREEGEERRKERRKAKNKERRKAKNGQGSLPPSLCLSSLFPLFSPRDMSNRKIQKRKKGGGRGKSQGTVESSQKRVSRCHLICWAARTGGGGVSVSLRFKKKKNGAKWWVFCQKGEEEARRRAFSLNRLRSPPSVVCVVHRCFFLSPRLPPLALLRHEGGEEHQLPRHHAFICFDFGCCCCFVLCSWRAQAGQGVFCWHKGSNDGGKRLDNE